MDAETVRLFEAVRDALAALDKGLLKPEEILQRLQGIIKQVLIFKHGIL